MMVELTFDVLLFIISPGLALSLLVLKYGELPTKLLFVIFTLLVYGIFVIEYNFYLGAILLTFGSLLAGYYSTKAIKSFISSF